jgi:DeoR/GlpR family transcriptional regulator of sugar metabolism
MAEWTFLTNHAVILSIIAHHPTITGRELADLVKITERAIRRIISDLHVSGYITKRRNGRYNYYDVNIDLPLRHHTHRETAVGNLLEALDWNRHAWRQSSKV